MNRMEQIKQSSSFQSLMDQYADLCGWYGDGWREDPDKLADAETFAFEMMEYESTYQSYDPLHGKEVTA